MLWQDVHMNMLINFPQLHRVFVIVLFLEEHTYVYNAQLVIMNCIVYMKAQANVFVQQNVYVFYAVCFKQSKG